LGDRLDLSYKRIDEVRFYLTVLFDDIGASNEIDRFPSHLTMAQWYRFWFTGEPDVEFESLDKEPPSLKITIPYQYPENLRKDFRYFRYQAEKDFEDLKIIFVLEQTLREQKNNENYAISIIRRENKTKSVASQKQESYIKVRGLNCPNERLLYCLKKICEKSKDPNNLDSVKKKIQADLFKKFSGKLPDRKTIFPCDVENPWDQCILIYLVEEVFKKNNDQYSYPDWQKKSIKSIENVRRVLCNCNKKINDTEMTEDEKKMSQYIAELMKDDGKNKTMLGLSNSAQKGLNTWKDKIEKTVSNIQQKEPFYMAGNTRYIPASMDVAYLLNLFRHHPDEYLSTKHISNISGLDEVRITTHCNKLKHEGLILYNGKNKTYSINLNKYPEVERILKIFDTRRAELVSMVRDIKNFKKPLALCSSLNETNLPTGIKGLDQIFSPCNDKFQGLPLRKSILLLGPPGSGKTTLALEIIQQIRLRRFPDETALYLTFEEDIQRILENFQSFGWTHEDMTPCVKSLCTLQSGEYLGNPEKFLEHFLNILDDGFAPDLVAIDNLGYFLQLVPAEVSREIFNRLIRVFSVRNITSLLLGEIIPGHVGFESYDVDGVINLGYKDGRRWIEITKMRGREFASGKHPFKIKVNLDENNYPLEPSIQVFPNIQMHMDIGQYYREKAKQIERVNGGKPVVPGTKVEEPSILSSGIKGLDDLLPLFSVEEGRKNGFERGEAILVIGSPGSGKTLLGLHFLKDCINSSNNEERGLWISFENDLKGLSLATRSFEKKAGLDSLIEEMKTEKKAKFNFYAPAQLEPDELVNFILEECKKGLSRLVLDSVTDLEQIFPTELEFKTFMTSLVQILREKKITTMFLYRTKSFFGKAEDIGRVLASVVDTIICLKVLEIQNALQKGLFLLKVRGREHRSRLISLEFKEEEGVIVSDRGWTMSGLISGEAGEIREPRVSVKLFFENRNERLINSLIVKEYNRRFKGGQTTFIHVMKPQIYSEFWSFKGSSGAGHSNVRVVSLCDYWATLFNRQGKLYNLWDYVSSGTRQLVRREEFWRRCSIYSYKDHAFKIFAVPNYVDVGVLAYCKEIKNLASFWGLVNNNGIPIEYNNQQPEELIEKEVRNNLRKLTWNMLNPENNDNLTKVLNEIDEKYNEELKNSSDKLPHRYLFAMPALSDTPAFVSFFLELYWSFGGAIFDFRKVFDNYAKSCKDKYENSIKSSKKKGEKPGGVGQNINFPQSSPGTDKDTNESETQKKDEIHSLYEFQFFSTDELQKSKMKFIAEILTLIPERVLNSAIQQIKKKERNLIGNICRHGDLLFYELLSFERTSITTVKEKPATPDKEESYRMAKRESAVTNTKDPLKGFIELIKDEQSDECPINTFIKYLYEWITKDDIWNKQTHLIRSLKIAQNLIIKIIKTDNRNKDEQKDLLLILYNILSRIVTNRERYEILLKWHYTVYQGGSVLSDIINIGKESKYSINTLEFLYQLVKTGIAPNPHRGDFTEQAYLARKWSGDIAPESKLTPSCDIIDPLDLHAPTEAYEYDERNELRNKMSPAMKNVKIKHRRDSHGIVPLPAFDRVGTAAPSLKKTNVHSGKWSYSVLGLWSLGITIPAVSPEIGWIFIDALTEDKFVEMRARRGLGLPAKVSAYNHTTIYNAQPDIYGTFDANGKVKEEGKGIVQYYQIATQDNPEFAPKEKNDGIIYRTRERASIPYYFKIEEILSKEFSRFFDPSFFENIPEDNVERKEIIAKILDRINNRIRNFLEAELKKQ